jgi:phage-related minor tail protein
MAKSLKGITIEIGGDTSPLDKALSGVNSKAKELQSELKQVNQALKFDPGNADLLAQKQAILKDEIGAVSEKLKTLKDAQEQVNRQFAEGKIDREQYISFQSELASTQSKLKSLKNELSDTPSKFDLLANGVKNATEKIKSVMDVPAKVVDVSIGAVQKYAVAAASAGTAVFGLTAKAAGAADDINTLATQTGLSTEQIQKFAYASDIIDVSLDTLTGAMAKNIKSMTSAKDGTGSAAEAYAALGVSVVDVNGQLRDGQTVFNEAIAALGKVSNETERDALAMQIFGKSAQDLNPLIKGGADTLQELGDKAEAAGLILSQDSLNSINAFNDGIDTFKATTSAAGKEIAVAFAPALAGIMDTVNAGLPNLAQMLVKTLQSGDSGELASGLTSFLNDVLTQINNLLPNFLNGFNAVLMAVVTSIVNVLPTITSTLLPSLISGLTNLISMVLNALPELIPTLAQSVTEAFSALMAGLQTVAEQLGANLPAILSSLATALAESGPEFIQAALTAFTGIATGLMSALPGIVAVLPQIITAVVTFLTSNITAVITAATTLFMGLVQAIPAVVTAIVAALPKIIDGIINGLLSALPQIIEAGVTLLIALITNLPQIITTIVNALPQIVSAICDGFIKNIDKIILAGVQLFVALIKNLPTIIIEIVKAVPQIIEGIVSAFGNLTYKIVEVGGNLIKGLWEGISDAGEWLWDKISGFFDGVVDRIKDFFGIHSPSKLFAELGGFMAQGLGVGFGDTMQGIAKDMQNAIPTTFNVDSTVKANMAGVYAENSAATAPATLFGKVADTVVIRDEADIDLLAEKLYNRAVKAARSKGVTLI